MRCTRWPPWMVEGKYLRGKVTMELRTKANCVAALAGLACLVPVSAHAQTTTESLMAMDVDSLRGEIQMRYDAGLAATLDQAILSANDSRFYWAGETKVQCGIALGFLKSRTKDETSVSKCVLAYQMMQRVPQPPPPPPPAPDLCDDTVDAIVFFEFDSSDLTGTETDAINYIMTNAEPCNWRSLSVVGHTDRAGSDAYNDALSMRRAHTVEAALRSRGITMPISVEAKGESQPRVPTVDGERNPQNRRVEITGNR